MTTHQQSKNLAELNRELLEARLAIRIAADRLDLAEDLAEESGLSVKAVELIHHITDRVKGYAHAADAQLKLLAQCRASNYEDLKAASERSGS